MGEQLKLYSSMWDVRFLDCMVVDVLELFGSSDPEAIGHLFAIYSASLSISRET